MEERKQIRKKPKYFSLRTNERSVVKRNDISRCVDCCRRDALFYFAHDGRIGFVLRGRISSEGNKRIMCVCNCESVLKIICREMKVFFEIIKRHPCLDICDRKWNGSCLRNPSIQEFSRMMLRNQMSVSDICSNCLCERKNRISKQDQQKSHDREWNEMFFDLHTETV